VTGGKWTTYRRMAEDVVDTVAASGRIPAPPRACATRDLKLIGAAGYTPTTHAAVAQRAADLAAALPAPAAAPPRPAVTAEAARHLAAAYGDRAFDLLELVKWSDGALAAPLAPGLPYIEAEVVYAVRQEYCASVEDFVARRTRMAFLDAAACEVAVPRVSRARGPAGGWAAGGGPGRTARRARLALAPIGPAAPAQPSCRQEPPFPPAPCRARPRPRPPLPPGRSRS
jgi:glycerol-3-phosphate dehydrogenase